MAHILVTNDDGIHAAGLRALARAVEDLGEVSVVAPLGERSGSAQAITVRVPIYYDKIAEREWAVEGTPADAVILALHALLPEKPGLILSGINPGGNLGENIFYSGTVGAAAEGAIHGIPSIAVSVAYRTSDFEYGTAAKFAARIAALALKEGLPPGMLLNVNVPQNCNGQVRFTRPSPEITRTSLKPGTDSRGRGYYLICDDPLKGAPSPPSDYAAIHAGAISITPLAIQGAHAESFNHLSHWAGLLQEK